MSLTNMRRVPGSSTSSIMRAASPPTSGIEANSMNRTRMTPSDAEIGPGTDQLAFGQARCMPARATRRSDRSAGNES